MLRLTLALSMSFALALSAAQAQMTSDVRFDTGNFGTRVSGTITGDEYHDFRLGASEGQEMFIELVVGDSTGNGTVYFNLLPPGSDGVAIYNGSTYGTTATIDLPETGTYTIRVYQMGNDRDTGATTGFDLNLSIQ
ncbi:hypothetical protein FIU97_15290 [Roseivivax sp. THAF40]|uniref:hypothetical protein n=1 Tax=unclassified Roseivivax TaxID=2639302 RepID=UPI00126866B6|nr:MULTISPECIES: hypothetical protein [unclassified Roseivivax]QFS84117.1 hypothetical protein FIV09_14880 [Roseivivax sp. THAF197b]QFT47944.1 hypothetical protein FIU97_15290 [Roseivivax sp. THAF40]